MIKFSDYRFSLSKQALALKTGNRLTDCRLTSLALTIAIQRGTYSLYLG